MGQETEIERILDCTHIADDPSIFFKVNLIDFDTQKEYVDKVEKTGGDYAKSKSSKISFIAKTGKVENEALQYIDKFFPKLKELAFTDLFICIGEMVIKDLIIRDLMIRDFIPNEQKISLEEKNRHLE